MNKPTTFLDTLDPIGKQRFVDGIKHFVLQLGVTESQSNPVRATKEAHKLLDREIPVALDGVRVSCKKGCSFCCYIHVDISDTEAQILAPKVTPDMAIELLNQAPHNLATWSMMPYKERKCVFLKNNECSVYEDRPLACRKYVVVSPAKKCNTEFEVNTTLGVGMFQAEAATSAVYLKYGIGSMARQLLKFLK